MKDYYSFTFQIGTTYERRKGDGDCRNCSSILHCCFDSVLLGAMLAYLAAMTIRGMRQDFERYINDAGLAGRVARQIHEPGMRCRDGEKLIGQLLRRWEANPQRARSDLFGLCLAHVDGYPEWEAAMLDWQERTGMWPTDWRAWYWGEAHD